MLPLLHLLTPLPRSVLTTMEEGVEQREAGARDCWLRLASQHCCRRFLAAHWHWLQGQLRWPSCCGAVQPSIVAGTCTSSWQQWIVLLPV